MANNRDSKQQRALERESYRNRYRIFKELRIWVACVLVLCIGLSVYAGIEASKNAVFDDDKYRNAVALYSGDDNITAMTLAYFFYSEFYALTESENFYKDGYGTYGLDPKLPLREQSYTALRSFYDELMNTSSAGMVTTLQYYVLAKENGLTLGDEEKAEIEKEIDELKAEAKAAGKLLADHLDYSYCPGMTEADVRAALEVYHLATKQYNKGTEEAFNCTNEEVEDYYAKHRDELLNTNIVRYEFKTESDSDGKVKQEYVDKAEEFAACKTYEEFLTKAEADLRANKENTEEVIEEFLDQCAITVLPDDFSGEIKDWLFDFDREDGDHFIHYGDDYCTVFVVMRACGKYSFADADSRIIYLAGEAFKNAAAAEAKAKEILALAEATPTEENFEKLVKEYSQDSSSAAYGGLCVDVVPGDLNYTCEGWLFAPGREKGDIGMVCHEGNYYIIYTVGFGDPCWYTAAKRGLVDEKITKLEETVEGLNKVEQNADVIYELIPDDLATDHDRAYTVKEVNGKTVYQREFKLFSLLNVSVFLTVLAAVATVWLFVSTANIKKKCGFNY